VRTVPFVDILTAQLFGLSISGFTVLYASTKAYITYRRINKANPTVLKSVSYESILDEVYHVSIPLILLGLYLLITALFGQFVWPLPGSYNILFYDPLALGSLVLISAGIALYRRLAFYLEYVGFLALITGAVTIWYGYSGYALGLTLEPLVLFLMYLFMGIAAILSYPYLLTVRRIASGQATRVHPMINALLAVFWASLFMGSLLAAYVGAVAVPAHLAHPP